MAPAPVKDLKVKYTQIFMNNEYVNSVSGKTFASINPATEEKVAEIQEGDKADIDKAVAAAAKAFELGSTWRRMDASQRGRLLYIFADLVERDAEILATLDTLEMGKPFSQAYGDVQFGLKWLRYYAGYADKLAGRTPTVDGDYFCYTRLEPVGVAGAILPWNFPFAMLSWKLCAALAAGCTLVVKPAEQTPLSALYAASLLKEAGFPAGVVNVVPGYGPTAGAALASHMDVEKIGFTGSTEVGRLVMEAAAKSNLKKVTLELGGKSPNVVFEDADLEYSVAMSHFSLFHNMGQCCTAGSRTYVQDSIYDQFVAKAVEMANKRSIGDPLADDIESGPQVDEDQYKKVLELIESGKSQGAKLMCGGGPKKQGKGYFIENTVFADVKDDMRIAKEEIFGPVQQIIRFTDINEVIPRANNTSYGLAASIFTKDIDKAIMFANSVNAGTVWVNCYHVVNPGAEFGGYKQSGLGREHGEEGIREYCETKTVYIKVPQKNS